MYLDLYVKCPTFLSDFAQIWTCLIDFHKSLQCKISRKSIRWEPSSYLLTEGRTDKHAKLIGAYCNYANAPKTEYIGYQIIRFCGWV
jgi:hypothetical protein